MKTNLLLILLLLTSSIITFADCIWGYDFPPINDDKCGFTREDALKCAIKYGDLNNDERLTPKEVKHALDTLIPSYLNNRLFKWISGLSVEQVFRDCDYNKDGVLTPRDWELATEKCMPTQKNLCTYKWFCDYAAKQEQNKKKQ